MLSLDSWVLIEICTRQGPKFMTFLCTRFNAINGCISLVRTGLFVTGGFDGSNLLTLDI